MRVRELFIYPVKACRGVALPSAEVVARGLSLDRRFMIVDERGKFLTQREIPRLALVTTELAQGTLRLSAPVAGRLEVPLAPGEGPRVPIAVWSYEGEAIEVSRAGGWLETFLGRPARLVYMPDDVERPVNPKYARAGEIVSFADGYPLLLIGQSSLEDLNRRLQAPVGIERFRPNIVVEGAAPHAEDDWRELFVGEVPFRVTKPCDRCSVVCVDPESGERGQEPLRTLATYRKKGEKVLFGVNLVHGARGRIAVGDPVRLSRSAARSLA